MQNSKYEDGISIIVTLFNKEEYILQTLISAVNQFRNKTERYQIIIVDDGSKDDSYKIANNFLKRKKIDYRIFTQKNSGPSIATNNALKFVKYSYIKLLDGDDILAPTSLKYMKSEMQKKNIDLLYGHWAWSSNPDKYNFENDKPESSEIQNAFEKFILNGWGGASNLMIKTQVFIDIKGCDPSIFVQDYSLPLKVAGNHFISKNSRKYNVFSTQKIICVGPSFIKERIMNNNAQTLYDLSIATLNFLENAQFVDKSVKRKALKKIIARCFSWRRRMNKEKVLGKFFLTYCLSKINLLTDSSIVRFHVYRTWISNDNVRKIEKKNKTKIKILVYVGLDLLGDGLLKIPLLKSIRKILPNAHITWLAGKGESVFKKELNPLTLNMIDKIYEEDFGSNFLDLFKKNKFGIYDVVIDTQKRFLTSLILKKIRTNIFISSCANYFFSDLVPEVPDEKNISQHLVNLSEVLSPSKVKFENVNIINNNKIAICPGASVIWKRWSFENFIQIAEHLIQKNLLPVFILGPKETDLERNLIREFGKKIKIFKSNDPMQTIKIAKNCRAGISNDTGCGHLISSTGTPTLTLFGPTSSEKFSPIGNPLHASISSQKTFKSKNINAIPVSLVISKLRKIVDHKKK